MFLGFGNLASPLGVDETFELDEMGVVMNRSSLEESRSHSAIDTFQAAMDQASDEHLWLLHGGRWPARKR